MSCLPATILPQLATISGLPVDRLEQILDTVRRQPAPSLPRDPVVVEVVLAGLPASHDPRQGEMVLQILAQGLRLALCQSRNLPPPRADAFPAHGPDGDGLAERPAA